MSEDTPAPGWYVDGDGNQRWWDGTGWTERTLPPPGAGPTEPGPPPAATATGGAAKPLLVTALVLGVIALLALLGINAALLAS
ncbi:DUF2510 domain-containing protein [Nocardioides panacisoli]|uniref:DUF2510 domain-containing protein n=1 Tax=Nocardioides panacisoli TaxID=627624 RepID=UPI001C62728B|nr:DUF2510 domain-containing protein [Nocardioides panacisoli]QYJ02971.1 DUF2510 domain-containing protein [Nocardioides panacisoli]